VIQIFSLAYGGVTQELKRKDPSRNAGKDVVLITSQELSVLMGPIESPQKSLVKKITEEGVVFQSYRDGSRMTLTPETTVEAQKVIPYYC